MGQGAEKDGARRKIGKSVIIGGLFVLVLAALVLYASSGLSRHTCEVCIVYEGAKACRKAKSASLIIRSFAAGSAALAMRHT